MLLWVGVAANDLTVAVGTSSPCRNIVGHCHDVCVNAGKRCICGVGRSRAALARVHDVCDICVGNSSLLDHTDCRTSPVSGGLVDCSSIQDGVCVYVFFFSWAL